MGYEPQQPPAAVISTSAAVISTPAVVISTPAAASNPFGKGRAEYYVNLLKSLVNVSLCICCRLYSQHLN